MEIDSSFNFSEINSINFNKVNYKSLNDFQSSSEETSFLTDENKEKSINKSFKFSYKRVMSERNCPTIVSSCERRLMKDTEELRNNENVGKLFKYHAYNYKKNEDTNNFEMIIEFINFFSVKFIFSQDYPFSPPFISFHSGMKLPNIFDSKGNILLESAQKNKWSPIIWLSTLVHSIELLISEYKSNERNIHTTIKYGKRNWNEYIQEHKKIFYFDKNFIEKIDKNIKGFKTFS